MTFDDKIVEQYEAMIWRIARGYTDDYDLMQDLVQEGWIGVHRACEQYDPTKGASPSTYIWRRAKAKMQQYLNYKASIVHVPVTQPDYEAKILGVDGHEYKHDVRRRSDTHNPRYDALHEILDSLPPYLYQLVYDYHVDELSLSMMAVKYKASTKTIKKWLATTRELIKAAMG